MRPEQSPNYALKRTVRGGSFRCNHVLRPARPLSLGVRPHQAPLTAVRPTSPMIEFAIFQRVKILRHYDLKFRGEQLWAI